MIVLEIKGNKEHIEVELRDRNETLWKWSDIQEWNKSEENKKTKRGKGKKKTDEMVDITIRGIINARLHHENKGVTIWITKKNGKKYIYEIKRTEFDEEERWSVIQKEILL